MGYECQIYKTLAGNGRGKTLLFHDIRTSINSKHTKFSYLCSYLKILFLPKWYLFLEQVTYSIEQALIILFARMRTRSFFIIKLIAQLGWLLSQMREMAGSVLAYLHLFSLLLLSSDAGKLGKMAAVC